MEKQLFQETFNELTDESVSSFVNRNKIERADILQILVRKTQAGMAVFTLFYYSEKAYKKNKY